MPAWALLAALLVLLALMQGVLLLLARGMGLRLRRAAIVLGLALPLVLLAPWLSPRRVLAPTGSLSGQVPGGPLAERVPHDLLNDTVFQFLPWELEVRHAWKAGRLPLWSDLLGGGSCLWCNPQAGALSPVAMVARPLPIQHFLLAALALKILVAFQGTWLLARTVGASRRAALLAGAGFALGGGILAWGLFPHTRAAAWIPWVVAGAIRTMRRPRAGRVAATALVTAALLLEGHPETALGGGFLAAFCALALARRPTVRPGRCHRASLPVGLTGATGAALLGFGLAAPQVLPFLALLPETVRAQETLEDRSIPGEVHLAQPASWFFEGRGLFWLAPVNPQAFGRPYRDPFEGPLSWPDATAPYAGIVAFAGAWAAVFALRGQARGRATGLRSRRTLAAVPFLAAAAVALLLASYPLPLMRLLYFVPPLRAVAYTRLLLIVALCLAVAGALGLDLLLRRSSGLRLWLGLGAATVVSLAVRPEPLPLLLWLLLWAAVIAARRWGGGGARRPGAGVLLPGSSEAAAREELGGPQEVSRGRSAGAGPAAGSPLSPAPVPGGSNPRPGPARAGVARLAGLLFGAVLLADLLPWARSHLPKGEPALFYPTTAAVERLRAELAQGGPWRAVGEDFLAYPDLLPVYGIAEVRPHNPMAPAGQLAVLAAGFDFAPTRVQYFAPFRRPDQPLLDFLNVRVVVSNAYQPEPPGFERLDAGEFEPFRLWRNPDALPRWFFASAVEAVPREDLPAWIAAMSDPRRVAVGPAELEGLRGLRSAQAAAEAAFADPLAPSLPPPPRPSPTSAAPGRSTLDLPAGDPAHPPRRLLATSLPDPAGWRVRAKPGGRLRSLTVNGAFLGVAIPPEARRLELRYVPRGLPVGAALMVVALVALAACLWSGRRTRRPGYRRL